VPCNVPEEWGPHFSLFSCHNVYKILYYYLSGAPNFEVSSSVWFPSWNISFVPYFFILVSSVLSCMIYRRCVWRLQSLVVLSYLHNCFISTLPDPNIPTDTHSCFSVLSFEKINFALAYAILFCLFQVQKSPHYVTYQPCPVQKFNLSSRVCKC